MLKSFGLFLFITGPALAGALDPKGPLAFSLSQTGRALTGAPAEYHLLNPAILSHSAGFNGSVYYFFGTDNKKPVYGLSLSENRKLPFAISYIKEREEGEQYLSLSTAGFLLPGWSLGLSVSRWQRQTSAEWNIQAGLLIRPKGSPFSLSAGYDYLLPLKGAFTNKRKWALGLVYNIYRGISFRTDAVYNVKGRWFTGAGLESLLSKFLVLRFGASWDFKEKAFVFSSGLGLLAKNLSLDYGLSRLPANHYLHTISARFFL